jgi:hypothetical protein
VTIITVSPPWPQCHRAFVETFWKREVSGRESMVKNYLLWAQCFSWPGEPAKRDQNTALRANTTLLRAPFADARLASMKSLRRRLRLQYAASECASWPVKALVGLCSVGRAADPELVVGAGGAGGMSCSSRQHVHVSSPSTNEATWEGMARGDSHPLFAIQLESGKHRSSRWLRQSTPRITFRHRRRISAE